MLVIVDFAGGVSSLHVLPLVILLDVVFELRVSPIVRSLLHFDLGFEVCNSLLGISLFGIHAAVQLLCFQPLGDDLVQNLVSDVLVDLRQVDCLKSCRVCFLVECLAEHGLFLKLVLQIFKI